MASASRHERTAAQQPDGADEASASVGASQLIWVFGRPGGTVMSVRRQLVAIFLLLWAPVTVARCSAEDEGLLGLRVRAHLAGQPPVVGVLADTDASGLIIESEDGGRLRLERASVQRLEVRLGTRRRALEGLALGPLAWAAIVGLYAAFGTLDESGVVEPPFIGSVIALSGVVGSLFKTEKWQSVSANRVAFAISPCHKGVRVSVAVAF